MPLDRVPLDKVPLDKVPSNKVPSNKVPLDVVLLLCTSILDREFSLEEILIKLEVILLFKLKVIKTSLAKK